MKNTYCLGLGQLTGQVHDPKYQVPGTLIGHSAGSYGLSGIMLWSPCDQWGVVVMATGLVPVEGKSFLHIIADAIYQAAIKE